MGTCTDTSNGSLTRCAACAASGSSTSHLLPLHARLLIVRRRLLLRAAGRTVLWTSETPGEYGSLAFAVTSTVVAQSDSVRPDQLLQATLRESDTDGDDARGCERATSETSSRFVMPLNAGCDRGRLVIQPLRLRD